jgi:prepilin-type N-terminal cleavage/methylation domain-containing protein
MRYASIGIPAVSASKRIKETDSRAGFTLIEALVALSLVLAFASVLGPYLFQARRIMIGSDRRVAAQVLLRSLVDAPVDRAHLAGLDREGDTEGLHWRVTAMPISLDLPIERQEPTEPAPGPAPAPATNPAPARTEPPVDWTAYRLVINVSWGSGQSISAETIRLGKPE